ncbi:MAG: flagellar basal body L-ring protein FlgH [Phycisphaerales bacterium]
MMLPPRARVTFGAIVLALAAVAPTASGQSLFLIQPPPPPIGEDEVYDPSAPLYAMSLFAVEPPQPRSYRVHDQVTIVIDETTRQQAQQSLKTEKEYDIQAALAKFPSIRNLLEFQLTNGDDSTLAELDLTGQNDFNGKGTYLRNDRFNAKITAEIIDVKPNGTLVLEARKEIRKDEEVQFLLLSGVCRRDDVTNANTVLSSQLANLTLISRNEGQVKDSATRGLIPRVLEFLFAF